MLDRHENRWLQSLQAGGCVRHVSGAAGGKTGMAARKRQILKRRRTPRAGSNRPDRLASALAVAVLCGLGLLSGQASAQIGSARYSSIVVDQATGRVMEQVNADDLRYPASLTKLMTLYMAFEALRDHRISLSQTVPVSAHAASMEPSKLGLVPGSDFTVGDAILAIVTKSANDAACALGELLGGDEARFSQMMTLRARGLGMTQTTFRNASGLPDQQQTTTARDLALLAHHLISDFPENYHYFSEPFFYFHGRAIPNHDRMLVDYEGADGLKTGYTLASGHNLVTSAMRGGVRLIGVVLGARSNGERDAHMANLLDDGFEQMGVPVRPRAPSHFHMPSLMASAEAAPLRPSVRLVLAHGGKAHGLVHRRLEQLALHRQPLSGQTVQPHLLTAHAVATCSARGHRHGCGFAARDKRAT
jgi:D-alanyl-D-alanine carboxypeptidase